MGFSGLNDKEGVSVQNFHVVVKDAAFNDVEELTGFLVVVIPEDGAFGGFVVIDLFYIFGQELL